MIMYSRIVSPLRSEPVSAMTITQEMQQAKNVATPLELKIIRFIGKLSQSNGSIWQFKP